MARNKISGMPLTPKVLKKLGFRNNGPSIFPHFENMHYWVKNRICLFYNTPIQDYQEPYYVGYAEQREGKYIAVAFRWIDTVEQLTEIYETLRKVKITDKI